MCLSHAYGVPPAPRDAQRVLHRAIELGITHFDTAALYGFGANESLLGEAFAGCRNRVHLATKCGMTGVDGRRVIDGRPETLKRTCRESLTRLRTDVIDLWYLHRWDKRVPVEESIGAMADIVASGYVRAIGLSEVSAATLRRASAVHPVSAVQNEYSLWSRNPELGLLEACRALGTTLVAFAPLARGFLAGAIDDPGQFAPRDIRRGMPRFQPSHFAINQRLLAPYRALAQEALQPFFSKEVAKALEVVVAKLVHGHEQHQLRARRWRRCRRPCARAESRGEDRGCPQPTAHYRFSLTPNIAHQR